MSFGRTFLPSLHDVHAGNGGLVEEILVRLEQWGMPPIALLVVPDHYSSHGKNIDEWKVQLQKWKARGHELLCHGLRHLRENSQSSRTTWENRVNKNQAEFADLSATESMQLLHKTLSAWEDLEVGPTLGFVPPTWFANPHLAGQCARLGWAVFENRTAVHICFGGRRVASYGRPPLSFAGLGLLEKPARVLALGIAQVPFLRLRLALHPEDFLPGHLGVTQNLVRVLLKKARCETYGELVAKTPK